jgi:hypothetical protein
LLNPRMRTRNHMEGSSSVRCCGDGSAGDAFFSNLYAFPKYETN